MRLNTVEFLLTQAWTAIIRNGVISGAAVINVAVALSVLGAFGLTAYNLDHMAGQQAAAVQITVELAKGAEPANLQADLLADPRVKSAEFIPREQALAELADQWGLDIGPLVRPGLEWLPDAVRVVPKDPDDVEALAALAQSLEGVQAVRYAAATTRQLLILTRGIKLSGLIVVIVLAIAALLVVSVTVRLTIYARRREIRIMQLVGATNWFIRVPFLLEGLFQGAVGGLVAIVLLLPGYAYMHSLIERNLGFLQLVYTTELLALLGVGLLLSGCLFGVAGSLIGLQEHLREV